MTRVLLVGDFPPVPTGFANVNYHIAKLLSRMGYSLRILTHMLGDGFHEVEGFMVKSLGNRYEFKKLRDFLSIHRFDVAVLSGPWFLWKEVVPALDCFDIPFIAYTTCEGRVLFDYVAPLMHAEKVLVPSEYARRFLSEYIPCRKMAVLPHGIDTRLFRPILRPQNIIFYPARYGDPRKQTDKVLEAFRRIRRDGLRLMFSGKPPSEDGVIGTWSNTHYVHGRTSSPSLREMPLLYSRSNVVVGVGAEGFYLPSIEAMATRRPIVALDVPPFNEIIGDKRLLVKPTYSIESKSYVYLDRERIPIQYTLHVPDVEELSEKILDNLHPSEKDKRRWRRRAERRYNYRINYLQLVREIDRIA